MPDPEAADSRSHIGWPSMSHAFQRFLGRVKAGSAIFPIPPDSDIRKVWGGDHSPSPLLKQAQGGPRPRKLSAIKTQHEGIHLSHSPRPTDRHMEKPERSTRPRSALSQSWPLAGPVPWTHMDFSCCSVLQEGNLRGYLAHRGRSFSDLLPPQQGIF